MSVDRPSIYTPGAGHRPPVLAGRDALIHGWQLMLNDAETRGRVGARDTILAGPRGIGKTATVLKYADLAAEEGFEVANLQADAGTANLIDSLARHAERHTAAGAGPWERVKHAFERIAAINLSVAGFGGGIATRPPAVVPRGGVAPEDLADGLARLDSEVRAERPLGGVLIIVDEMQVAAHSELALLAAALHRLNGDHPDAHVLFAGTGLPHIGDVLVEAGVTHPDRLFDVRQIPLTLEHPTRYARSSKPRGKLASAGIPNAAMRIVEVTNGYPAHLQLFADHAWHATREDAVITLAAAEDATRSASAELEERTLGPRLERLSDRQAELRTAIAINGGRAGRSDITTTLGRSSPDSFSRPRGELLAGGDIYAPRYGEVALTVPLLGPYLIATYETLRERTRTPLLPLAEMRRNAGTLAISNVQITLGQPPRSHRQPTNSVRQ